MKFPAHKAGLQLQHNDHLNVYETVAHYTDNDYYEDAWVSDEQKAKAIATNELWNLHWYPDTPVGFYHVCGADLDAVLTRAAEIEAADAP